MQPAQRKVRPSIAITKPEVDVMKVDVPESPMRRKKTTIQQQLKIKPSGVATDGPEKATDTASDALFDKQIADLMVELDKHDKMLTNYKKQSVKELLNTFDNDPAKFRQYYD